MFVCVCLGEVQLTCKQAPVSSHGMSRDTCNTSEDILQMKKGKCSITTRCTKKAGYSNPVAVAVQQMKSVKYVWGGGTVECHPLTSAESMRS